MFISQEDEFIIIINLSKGNYPAWNTPTSFSFSHSTPFSSSNSLSPKHALLPIALHAMLLGPHVLPVRQGTCWTPPAIACSVLRLAPPALHPQPIAILVQTPHSFLHPESAHRPPFATMHSTNILMAKLHHAFYAPPSFQAAPSAASTYPPPPFACHVSLETISTEA